MKTVSPGPVDAALGIDQGIERGGRRAAFDAPVGQVERARLEVEETIIALAVLGDERDSARPRPCRAQIPDRNGYGRPRRCAFAVKISLSRAIRRTSTPASGWALASERRNT